MARVGVSLSLALALTLQWLGWAGSTGDSSVHYVAADATIVPPRHRRAVHPAYLPHISPISPLHLAYISPISPLVPPRHRYARPHTLFLALPLPLAPSPPP